MEKDIRNGMVIFGGTGDLTKRKLMPAIYNLLIEQRLPEHFFVVAVGRRNKTREEFAAEMKTAVESYSRNTLDEAQWDRLEGRVYYYQMSFDATEAYLEFDNYLCRLENQYETKGNRLFYLAVSPEYFGVIVDRLHQYGLDANNGSFRRVIIEKPFGKDLDSAKALSRQITHAFGEENTYRIDHYLGKEMLQNIMVIRFANAFFEPIWNNKYIDHIQITSTETLGVSERGGYYETSGAMKDMLQNHLLQLLAITAMEPPANLDAESIRDEKVKVFKSLRIFHENEVCTNVVRGQYGASADGTMKGYREESRTDNASNTETFVAVKAEVENFRWAGVPFYIRTGKRLRDKVVEVVVQFKPNSKILYLKEYDDMAPNQLIIKIQPTEGVNLQFNAKQPGQSNHVVPVAMDFCQNCEVGYNSPEAYERLLLDAMKGEKTLFTRWDEVEYSWRFVDVIAKVWAEQEPDFPNYEAGSYGPKAADELLARDGYRWRNEGY